MSDLVRCAKLARATTVTAGGRALNASGTGAVVQETGQSFLVRVVPVGGGVPHRFVVPKTVGGVWLMPAHMEWVGTFELRFGHLRTKPIAGTGGADASEGSGSGR